MSYACIKYRYLTNLYAITHSTNCLEEGQNTKL